MDEVRNQLQDIFRDVFDDPEIEITDQTTADDVDGWDSLAHINLMIAVERGFRVKFATAEISRLKEEGANVGSIVSLVSSKVDARR